jgi:lipid II:glycine glycyltransferase (peptidoglycan interpeptide bridge formation enzyme)
VAIVNAVGDPIACAQVLVRPTPLGPYGYVPRGPVCAPDAVEAPMLIAAVRRSIGRGIAIRYEPNWRDGEEVPAVLAWRRAVATQPRSTMVVDLTLTETELLARLHQKWRYNLHLAERRGVRVREGGEDDLNVFGRLMTATASRDGFGARPPEYYAWAWRAFRPHSHLLLAENNGAVLGAVMTFHFGAESVYLYGASADEGRRDMPNHLLQWSALRLAKADGRTRYDLWGIPDAVGVAARAGSDLEDVDTSSDALRGVWGFKRGMGGAIERTVGAFDDVLAPWRYRLVSRLEAMRRPGSTRL